MNKNGFTSKISRLALVIVAVVTVVSLALAAPSGSVFADSSTPTPRASRTGGGANAQNAGAALSSVYQKQQDALSKQADVLSKASGDVSKIQDMITKAQNAGVDSTQLQNALSTFQSQLTNAQNSHNNAASILSNHAGFDGSGNVTDPAAARNTLQSAGQAMRDAHTILSQAVKDLHSAFATWRTQMQAHIQDQLKKDLDKENAWAAEQSKNLDKANAAASQLQDFISRMSGKGIDIAALQSALSTFQGQIAQAQTAHDQALSTLGAHSGFSGGNVTDPKAAAQTLKDANQSLKSAMDLLVQATTDLKNAVQSWKVAHPQVSETPGAPVTETPATNNG
jgi:DNA repair exonuclease SbcCD ATPase subunit